MMKKPTPAKHRLESRVKDGATNEILIWHGEQVIFHLKRMAPDFIWFATYIDNKGEDVEIKIGNAILTMNGAAPKTISPVGPRKKEKEKPPTPDANAEETKPETVAATASESAT